MDKFFLLGYPIHYSLSPKIYKEIFKEREIDAIYALFPTKKEELRKRIKDFLEDKTVKGFNLTQPLKEEILKFDIELRGVAREIHSVNSVKIQNKKLIGFNTDYVGFKKSLLDFKEEILQKNAAVFGAGGAAKAVAKALIDVGVSNVFVINRTFKKAEKIKELFDGQVLPVPLEDAAHFIKQSKIIINATTVGLKDDKTLIKSEWINKDMILYDLIYAKKTKFLRIGEEKAKYTKNGFDILYFQCIENINIWYGEKND